MSASPYRQDLLQKRDRKMVEEFFNLYDVQRLRMDDVLQKLSQDVFFLSEKYIYERIFSRKENSMYYDSLTRSKKKA